MALDANCVKAKKIGLEIQQNIDHVFVSQAKKNIGLEIQQNIDHVFVCQAKIKRTDHRKALKLQKKSLKIGQKKINIDSS